MAALKQARARYPGPVGQDPVLRGYEIKSALELDDLTYRKLSTLIFSEGWFFKGGSGDVDGDWTQNIAASILRMDRVETIHDYFNAVAEHRFGPAYVPSHQVAAPHPNWGRAEPIRRWLANREVSAGDLLIIGILGSVVAGIVLWLVTR